MKYVKIIFRHKDMKPVHLPLPVWEEIIKDPSQIIKYTLPEEGSWTGRTFNKADVSGSEPDSSYTVPETTEYDFYRNTITNTVVKLPKGSSTLIGAMYSKL